RQALIDRGKHKEPKDRRGHTIRIWSPGGIGMVWTERMLAKGGLTPDDIRLTTLTFPDQPAAFANKGIDSAFVVEPFVTVAEAQRAATNVMPSNQLYAGLVAMVLGMSPVFAREQPEAAKRFVTAYLRGQRDYWRAIMKGDGDKEELYQILSQFTPIHETRLFERMATHDVEPNGEMDPRTPNELQDYFVKYGTQPQKVDLAKVLDRSYADYAIQRIGRVQP